MYISLLTASIPVNYTSEFRGLFQATTYGWSRNGQGRGSILGRARSINHTTTKSTLVPTRDRRAQLSLNCIYICTTKAVEEQHRRVRKRLQNALQILVQEFISRKLCVKMSQYKREVYNRLVKPRASSVTQVCDSG